MENIDDASQPESQDKSLKIGDRLAKYFNLDELNDLIFKMRIDGENLPHRTKPELIRELIKYCERCDRISDLEHLVTKTLNSRDARKNVNQRYTNNSTKKPQSRFILILTISILTFFIGILTNILSDPVQKSLDEKLTPSLIFQLAMLALTLIVLLSALQVLHENGKISSFLTQLGWRRDRANGIPLSIESIGIKLMHLFGNPKGKQLFNTALWLITMFSAFCFFAYNFASVDTLYETSPFKFIFICWICLTSIPLAVALYSGEIEQEFQTKLNPKANRGLFIEKLFGVYITATLGEIAFLILLLLLDVYLNIWMIFSFGAKFVFWMIAQLVTTLICLVGASVANKYWSNKHAQLPKNLSPDRTTLILVLSFPFFLIPILGVSIAVFIVPYLKDPLWGPLILIASAFALYRSIQKD